MKSAEINRDAIAKRLKDLRGDRTQAEVADAVGVTAMAISQYEQGLRMPVDEVKVKLANYYQQSVASIFFT